MPSSSLPSYRFIWFHLVSPLHRQCPTVTTDPPATPRRCSGKVRAGRASSDTQHQQTHQQTHPTHAGAVAEHRLRAIEADRPGQNGQIESNRNEFHRIPGKGVRVPTQHPFVAVNSSFQVPLCYDSHCHLLSSAVKGKVDSS